MSDPLSEKIEHSVEVLRTAAAIGPVALASSLSAEDVVVLDLIVVNALPISVFTLDTGRLHPETVALIDESAAHFGIEIEVLRPNPEAVAAYVSAHGANAFYESVELRKACCGIRKVEPLNRALAGKAGWVTGQRRDQSVTRSTLAAVEHDDLHGIAKYNPLADWTWDEVMAYAKRRQLPLNPLHARGYPSIGCDPCTRAIRPGEDPRAGRWWWEQQDSKECGLHVTPLKEAAEA
jgi:phosphoadenosine phosphosulfate reductase